MATQVEISRALHESMVRHVLSIYPMEGCGLLAGNGGRVQQLYAIDNIRNSPIEYEMDPGQQLRAMIDLEEKGWELIAIYHSHPNGPPVPSASDVSQAYYPETAYVIISLVDQQQPSVRCFNIVSGKVAEVPLLLV